MLLIKPFAWRCSRSPSIISSRAADTTAGSASGPHLICTSGRAPTLEGLLAAIRCVVAGGAPVRRRTRNVDRSVGPGRSALGNGVGEEGATDAVAVVRSGGERYGDGPGFRQFTAFDRVAKVQAALGIVPAKGWDDPNPDLLDEVNDYLRVKAEIADIRHPDFDLNHVSVNIDRYGYVAPCSGSVRAERCQPKRVHGIDVKDDPPGILTADRYGVVVVVVTPEIPVGYLTGYDGYRRCTALTSGSVWKVREIHWAWVLSVSTTRSLSTIDTGAATGGVACACCRARAFRRRRSVGSSDGAGREGCGGVWRRPDGLLVRDDLDRRRGRDVPSVRALAEVVVIHGGRAVQPREGHGQGADVTNPPAVPMRFSEAVA